ncbi:uncharacterized protein UBRO2_05669 [Ustilago bromivora]|uniref:Uncharacterized protein n=1 Tax=Ustilago bromivora TaxID=307758 RepID=A0A8H8TUY3_9BASI|nr:uncharacterized protein UBRO2_05669 [Ustilago bromivora]
MAYPIAFPATTYWPLPPGTSLLSSQQPPPPVTAVMTTESFDAPEGILRYPFKNTKSLDPNSADLAISPAPGVLLEAPLASQGIIPPASSLTGGLPPGSAGPPAGITGISGPAMGFSGLGEMMGKLAAKPTCPKNSLKNTSSSFVNCIITHPNLTKILATHTNSEHFTFLTNTHSFCVANLLTKMEVQIKDKNGVAHVIDTSDIRAYQPDTISKVVTILACDITANYETTKVIQEFIASVRDDYLQQLEDLSNEWRSAGSNEGRTSIAHDFQHIGDLMIHTDHIALYLAEACNNSENGLEMQELKEAQTLQQAAFIGHRHSGYHKFRHYTKLNWESIFSTESPATPPLTAAAASTIPVVTLSSVIPEVSVIAISLASISHTSTTPSSTVSATFPTPVATSSAPAAHSSTTTSSLKPAESTASNGNSSATAKHSSATSPSITHAASMQPVAASSEPLKHSSAKISSSAPAATSANPFATSSVSAKHSSVTPSQKKKTRKQRADEIGWYSTWPMAVKEWHNDKQAELEDWKKDTDEEAEAHDKELERLGFAGLDLARKYVMEYGDGSSDDEPEAERDIDFGTKESNTTQQGYLDKVREMLKTEGLHKAQEEDRAKVEKLLQQPDAEGKVVEEVDSDTNLYCNMPPGDLIVPIQAGTMHTAESHNALGASQGPLMSYSQDTVEPPSKLPFAETPNTNVMEHYNSQPTNNQDAAMPGSGGVVPAPGITKRCKGKMCQVRDPSLSPPPSSDPQQPVVEVKQRVKWVATEKAAKLEANDAPPQKQRVKWVATEKAAKLESNLPPPMFWLDQSLAAKWDGLVSQGKAHVVANVMVYCSLAVFAHQQYDKVRLNDYIAGVAPKILRVHCGNKFDGQGTTRGAGYKVARHGAGQPTTTPNPPSGSKRTAAEAGLATSQMRPGPRRLVPSQGNINLAYRSVDIAKGTHAEAAQERISMAAKGLVEHFGINNRSEEESKEEALEDFADAMIAKMALSNRFGC